MLAAAGRSRSTASGSKRRMSPGWHESASQIASSVEKRIARAFPELIVWPSRDESDPLTVMAEPPRP